MTFKIYHPLVLVFYFLLPSALLAEEYPPSYPWHGVSINSSAEDKFAPDDLQKLTNFLPGLNFVQLRLRPKNSARRKKITLEKAMSQTLDWANLMLDECVKLNIIGLISFEGFPLDLEKNYNHTSPQFWKNKNNLNEVVNTAATLANHFSKRGKELAAYQFISEPVVVIKGNATVPEQWQVLLPRIIKAIRNYDPQRWIVVTPGPWGRPIGYRNFKPLGEKIIYGAHMYYPHSFTHQGITGYENSYSYPARSHNLDRDSLTATLHPLKNFQSKYNVPIYIGEFSAIRWAKGSENYLKDLVSIFNEYKWGWAYFSLNGWHGWNPNYSNKNYLNWRRDWKKQYIGKQSERWKTLRTLLEK